jgi:small-conductance mechanosensitive channel
MIVLVVTTLMEMFSLPLPLFRLYTVATALVALLFCLQWANEGVRLNESRMYPWVLRLASFFFAIIVIAELWGKAPLPFYLLTSLMRSTAAVLLFMLFMYMIRGGLEWLFRTSPMRRTSSLYSDTDALVRRVGLFIDIAIWGLVVVPAVFVIWGVYDNLEAAVKGLLGLGFKLGTLRISAGLLIVATGFVYSSFLLSWILQNLLLDKVLLKRRVERGVRVSIKRLVHYVLIFIGFLLAISSLGLELTKLTIVLSALGVGIGFGLQGVVNNFVSGLILLFERPVRVGDYIELNGNWCEIEKIGLRATTVQTFDQADVIIPNADLVTNQVTNWTLRNRRARLIIPVGVAYGSDIPLVIETLKASADPYPMVAKNPAPQVLFLSFGESSLDFELRVWVQDVDKRLTTRSELHQEIDRRFREAKIEIAFPQRDVHFRSVNESISFRSPDTI